MNEVRTLLNLQFVRIHCKIYEESLYTYNFLAYLTRASVFMGREEKGQREGGRDGWESFTVHQENLRKSLLDKRYCKMENDCKKKW